MSQPRRIATENLSDFVGERIGRDFVGFHHKARRHLTPNTRITYTVEKSLLNELIRDPLLSKYDAVVLDEIHERSVDLDIIMPLLKKAQVQRKSHGESLKVVLASATLDRDKITKYFQGASSVEVPGRTFPVREEFLTSSIDPSDVVDAAAKRTVTVLAEEKDEGDILIFMPGREEISRTIAQLQSLVSHPDVEFIPLLGGDETTNAYKRQTGKRKVIVATNVAETSITIPTVRIVIDSGLMRQSIYNPETGITELVTTEHTQSNALQRKGRAGRTAPGVVYYLFTKEDFDRREQYLPAQIYQTNLTSLVLQMKYIGIQDIHNFDFLDHPGKEKIDLAIATLKTLGALDRSGNITQTYGVPMAEIDADPHYARMLVEAQKRNCEDAVGLLIGLMGSRKSVYDRNFHPELSFSQKYNEYKVINSDFLTLLNIWNDYVNHNTSREERIAWATHAGINTFTLYTAANARRDLFSDRRIRQMTIPVDLQSQRDISVSIAAGLLDGVLIKENHSFRFSDGRKTGIIVDRHSVVDPSLHNKILSGKLSYNETTGKTYAGFNIAFDEELAKEVAPYLFDRTLHEETALKPKEETVKPATLPQTTKRKEEGTKGSPTPLPEKPEVKKKGLIHLPKRLWNAITTFAKRIQESINNIVKKIHKFFTGK